MAQSCKQTSFGSPNPTRALHIHFKPDLGPTAKFAEWVKICATTPYQKT